MRRDITKYDYQFASDEKGGITRFPVRSNSTGVLHAEEMIDLGGRIEAKLSHEKEIQVTLENQTRCDVRDVWVCGMDRQGRWVEGALGDLRTGRDRSVRLDLGRVEDRWPTIWDSNELTQRQTKERAVTDAKFNIGDLLESTLYSIEFRPGKLIALGWSEQSLGSLEISPVAKQQNRVMLVLIHLEAGVETAAITDKVLPSMEAVESESEIMDKMEENNQ